MTWSAFKAAVKAVLLQDANRRGAEAFLEFTLKQAAIQIQSLQTAYQKGHETIYTPEDFSQDGSASIASLPTGYMRFDKAQLIRSLDEDCTRYDVEQFEWQRIAFLISGQKCLNANTAYMAVNPQRSQFYVYPAVLSEDDDEDGAEWRFNLYWDGILSEFEDDTETPFDDSAIAAAVHHIKANHSIYVLHDNAGGEAAMRLFMAQMRTITRIRSA